MQFISARSGSNLPETNKSVSIRSGPKFIYMYLYLCVFVFVHITHWRGPRLVVMTHDKVGANLVGSDFSQHLRRRAAEYIDCL